MEAAYAAASEPLSMSSDAPRDRLSTLLTPDATVSKPASESAPTLLTAAPSRHEHAQRLSALLERDTGEKRTSATTPATLERDTAAQNRIATQSALLERGSGCLLYTSPSPRD